MKILDDPITVAALCVAAVAVVLILLGCQPKIIEVQKIVEKQVVVTATPTAAGRAPRFPEGTNFAINDGSNFIFQIYDAKFVVGQHFYVLVMVKADKEPGLVGTFWEYPATDETLQAWINNEQIRILDLETY